MAIENYNVVGVMSGTSLDGVDLAHIQFNFSNGTWAFEILENETIPYPPNWVDALKDAVGSSQSQLKILDADYTLLLAKMISHFIQKNQIKNLDAVCSHGHTILHQPQKGLTLQIGNLPEIAILTGQTVVCDFRVQDVQLGGQGAPLVPIGDKLLFPDDDYCLNLGGFSNVSFEWGGQRVAFDISPVNTVLNFYAAKLGFAYDDKGHIAQSGAIHHGLLGELNDIDFYAKDFPKSLGFEFVKHTVLPVMESIPISAQDKMRTLIEHIAMQIMMALPTKTGKMLVTGGGAYNDFLLERIKKYLPEIDLVVPDKNILEFKEALIFALLGVLKLRGEINVLSSVTGASHDHSSGKIWKL